MPTRANLPYKVAIGALGRMLSAGNVTCIGRKYSSLRTLAGHPLLCCTTLLTPSEKHGMPTAPHGGARRRPPFVGNL